MRWEEENKTRVRLTGSKTILLISFGPQAVFSLSTFWPAAGRAIFSLSSFGPAAGRAKLSLRTFGPAAGRAKFSRYGAVRGGTGQYGAVRGGTGRYASGPAQPFNFAFGRYAGPVEQQGQHQQQQGKN